MLRLLVLLPLISALGAVETALIPNGSMDAGLGVPIGWDSVWNASGKLEAIRDTDVFASAPASLCLRSVGGAADGNVTVELVGVAGRRVTISGKVRCGPGVTVCAVAVQAFAAPAWNQIMWQPLIEKPTDNQWTAFKDTVEIPASAASAKICLMLAGDGKVWLDDVVAVASP